MGFGCEYMLLLKRTAKSSPLTYPGNLGRTCRRQIRHTANARTETFKKESRQSRKVSMVLLAAVGGGRSHCIAVERVCWFAVKLAFALQGLAHFLSARPSGVFKMTQLAQAAAERARIGARVPGDKG